MCGREALFTTRLLAAVCSPTCGCCEAAAVTLLTRLLLHLDGTSLDIAVMWLGNNLHEGTRTTGPTRLIVLNSVKVCFVESKGQAAVSTSAHQRARSLSDSGRIHCVTGDVLCICVTPDTSDM